jgi:peptidoglycan/xylan/chitin deacetylase (PgdA/CDA1 family)/glycosyltransferase involved in cell wall biosynthesis
VNILHVLSQYEVTGAETYAAALIARQVRDGHRVTVASDTFTTPVEAEIVALPIGRRAYPRRLANVVALRRLIRSRDIHLVHAHSRAACWVAYFATRRSRVPLVSTLHAIQPLHPSARAFSVYGEAAMAVSASVRENAIAGLGLPPERVHLVPNGVDLDRFQPGGDAMEARRALGLPADDAVIALIGRLSGPRGPIATAVVAEVMPRVRNSVPGARLIVVGGASPPAGFAAALERANAGAGAGRVRHLGHVADVRPALAAADVVIAAGRSALEAMASGRPVVALGETHYVGVLDDTTAEEGRRSNFGDTGERRPLDAGGVAADLAALLGDAGRRRRLGEWGRSFVARHYDARVVWRQAEAVYRQARAARTRLRIPVVMYHRIVASAADGGRHGIWVTRERFAAQLAQLQRRGFTTVTFEDVAAHLDGGRRLPRRPILLTFDDGYADNHALALPLLRQHHMRAVVFLIGDPSLRSNVWDAGTGEPAVPLLDDAQLREMAAAGIEFGSHTATHARLTTLSPERLAAELEGSRRALEARTGRPVLSLCYPYGDVNRAVKAATAAAGYRFGVASDSGPLRFGDDLLEIRRAQIFPRTDGFGFWKKTSGWYLRYRQVTRRLGKWV